MGLFDRKPKAAPVPELPPTLSDADLGAASRLLDRWDTALGNSDDVWSCIDSFARIGGYRGFEAVVMETGPGGKSTDDVLNRPWRWWAEAARLANARGEHALAGRIFLFSYLFINQILPSMGVSDQIESGLGKPVQGTYESIAASAVDSLSQLPPDHVIHDTATGKVDVASALDLARSVG